MQRASAFPCDGTPRLVLVALAAAFLTVGHPSPLGPGEPVRVAAIALESLLDVFVSAMRLRLRPRDQPWFLAVALCGEFGLTLDWLYRGFRATLISICDCE
jgi:hypothetical protein